MGKSPHFTLQRIEVPSVILCVGYSWYSNVKGLLKLKCCQTVELVQGKAIPLNVGSWLSPELGNK